MAFDQMEWRYSNVPDYEVSEQGDLRLLKNKGNYVAGNILKGSCDRNGYRRYRLRIKGCRTGFSAHRLTLLAFVGPPPTPRHQCAHWDGNPSNNHYSNLRWATAAENAADRVRHGNHLVCYRKFTAEEVLDIRFLRASGETYSTIRKKYDISKGHLSNIINRSTRKHI